mmetsp:Transcript_9239/g.14010  ORF Transcript_9239/g.14010 Transcript_9239/m.14010 type:complete len:115 (-) Transcript_9239:169-513(-)
MTEEIELLTTMFSNSARDLLRINGEHRTLQKKFTDYHEKSEAFIKDRDVTISEQDKEIKKLNEEYSSFDIRFSKKKKEADQLKKQLTSLEKDFADLKKISIRQKKEIEQYEEKY